MLCVTFRHAVAVVQAQGRLLSLSIATIFFYSSMSAF